MKKLVLIYIIGFLAILIFTSCSSTYKLTNADFTLSELDEKIRGEDITIIMTDRKVEEGKNATINNLRTYWVELNSGQMQDIHTKDIREIIVKNHTLGALEGLGFGMLAYFPLAAVVSNIGAEGGRSNYSDMGGAVVGLLAVIGGPIIGAAVGHKNIYILNEQKSKTVKIQITSIKGESDKHVVVDWNNAQISLKYSEILKIEHKKTENLGEVFFIIIPEEVFNQKFKKLIE